MSLEDTVREPFAASLVKATGPEESVGEMINNHTASDFQTEVNGDSDIQVPPASVEAVVADPQENATVQPLQSNLPLGERGSTSDMGDLDATYQGLLITRLWQMDESIALVSFF